MSSYKLKMVKRSMQTKSITKPDKTVKDTIHAPLQKSPLMSQFMEENMKLAQLLDSERDDFSETSLLNSFQKADSEVISKVLDSKGPYYRRISTYTKSIRQYWRERKRRKQVSQLSSEGHTYTEIADKLGVSLKTVQRDMKKVSRYYHGQLNKAWRIMKEERQRKWARELEGLSIWQQYKIVTGRLAKHQKIMRGREYKRHLMKIVIDMDDLRHDVFPTLKVWPETITSVILPLHVQIILRSDGQNMKYGSFTVGAKG